MTVTPKTTIHTLLKEHPPLLEFFVGYHPEFGKLANPVLRQTMARMATLERVAAMANVPAPSTPPLAQITRKAPASAC